MNTNTDVKVSVVVPIYNASDYLCPAMDSILDQTLSEIEIICVDDGSTDRSLEIIKQYQEKDGRIRIVTETNAGPALARNNGMRRARGEYVAFFDADDFAEPTFLESLYNLAKKDDLDIAISKYDIYNSRRARFERIADADHSDIFMPGTVTSKNEHPDCILASTVGSAWNKIFRRSFIEEKQLAFLSDVKMYEDVYFVVTAMSLAERVGKVFDVLVHHRIHSEQSRAKMFKKYYSQVPIVYQRIREFLVQHGMYAPLSLSYLNLSASRCYKIYNLLPGDAKEEFFNMLNGEYSELLGWSGHDSCDFESAEVCEFVLNVLMYNHEQYKKRCSRGAKFEIDRADQTMKNAKRIRRIRHLFTKLFHKENKI